MYGVNSMINNLMIDDLMINDFNNLMMNKYLQQTPIQYINT